MVGSAVMRPRAGLWRGSCFSLNCPARRRLQLGLLWILLIAPGSQAQPQSEEATRDARSRFETEAPAGWDALEKMLSSVKASATWRLDIDNTDSASSEYHKHTRSENKVQIFLSQGAGKSVVDAIDGSGAWARRTVSAYSSDYGFVAGQASQDGPYFVKSWGRDEATIEKIQRDIHLSYGMCLKAAVYLDSDLRPLRELVSTDGFHLSSCIYKEQGGVRLVESAFDFLPGKAPAIPGVRHVTVLLDPEKEWRVVGCTTVIGDYTVYLTLEYFEGSNFAAVKRYQTRVVSPIGTRETTISCESLSGEAIPPSEFRLSSVGLPEFSKPALRSSRLFFIGVNFLILAALLLLGYIRLRSRRARSDHRSKETGAGTL
jgi:hypothetical protein